MSVICTKDKFIFKRKFEILCLEYKVRVIFKLRTNQNSSLNTIYDYYNKYT